MKTTEQWFNELNENYREKALKNMINPTTEHFSLAGAVSNGFVWSETPEGKEYWNGVFREIMYGEKFIVETNKNESSVNVKSDIVPAIATPIQTELKLVENIQQTPTNTIENKKEEPIKETPSENLFEVYKKEKQISNQ